jgi:DNA-binding NarL/FixJ family response regulator
MTRRTEGLRIAAGILIVDDDPLSSRAMVRGLRFCGSPIRTAYTLRDAVSDLESSQESAIGLVLLDLNLPDGDGADVVPVVRRRAPDAAIVVVSGYLTATRCLRLSELDVDLSLPKPLNERDLRCVVARLCERRVPRHSWVLSPREHQVLSCAGRGLARKEAAALLGISIATVATHWKRICEKTGLPSERMVIATLTERAKKALP